MSESEKEEGPIYVARGAHTRGARMWSRGTSPRVALIELLKQGADPGESFKIIKLPDGAVKTRTRWEDSIIDGQDVPLDRALIDDLEFELYDRLYVAVKIVELVEHLQGSSSKHSKNLIAFVEKMEANL